VLVVIKYCKIKVINDCGANVVLKESPTHNIVNFLELYLCIRCVIMIKCLMLNKFTTVRYLDRAQG
jgi:hypothetical protein